MKTKLLAFLLALPLLAHAQFSQNFDAGTTAPAGWSVINGGDLNEFIFGPGAPRSVYSLPNAAQINYSAAPHDDYLVTPAITVTAGVNDRLTYFVKNQDPNYVESYAVKLSTTTATAAAFTTVLTPVAPAPNKWTFFSIDLSAYIGQTVYVGFQATSADMFRLLFDNINSDTAPTAVPNCSTLVSPSNGQTGVNPNAVTLTWAAPTSGAPVDSYEVYLDTNPNPTTLVSSNYLFADFNNLLGNTTYYWKVVAKNAAGVAVACQTNSFVTGDSFAPYCFGNLLFTSGVEPITSVKLSDMTNTSSEALTSPSHENFVNKVASVEQGGTYPITFKGNTDGNNATKIVVYIDWNQDGDFLDAGEVYFGAAGTAVTITNSTGIDAITATGNIVVPATATLGKTRMRVKKNYATGTTFYLSPCYSSGTGLAAVSGTGGYGQAEDYSIMVLAPGTLTVNETKAKSALAVYPNPMKDILNITTADKKITEVTFYSAEGRLVKSVKGNIATVNTNDLKSGVYVVKVKTSDSEQTFKVIKE
ncbi:choice-of-anchor J domain-containing protein [Chryseobacterium sp. WG14]|uniref:T9SS-dependent choice-of-anchor J family protein n=1 Tax=Chryseobacterium sp. WG14 TaxID=2926909 RepID=UPI00211DB80F|nr:choice-of-anchor J domain-containing protein [Chryseobacterium sp. WG14]MCQ9641791.1 choice-of-anchor J domain-containing protein [Chryseobacterium sp. WG14]